jgi:glycosyltransferase involved in cell wall biosynthesis
MMKQAGQRITVLIPTYNRAQWLGGAIDSVLAQTRTDFRLIVSDNASTDGTTEVVGGYDDPRIAYVRRDVNCGLNKHYNEWFRTVDAEYLFIVPDDDRLVPDALERTVAALEANPRAALAHGRVDVVDEHGAVIAVGHHMTGLAGAATETGQEFIARSMAAGYRVHASTVNLRVAAVREVLLDERDFPLTDLGHWMRVALDWELIFLDRTLALYRVHDGAYSAGAASVAPGGYIQGAERVDKALEVKLRFLDEHGDRVHGAQRLCRTARRAYRRELVEVAAHATFPQRRLLATLRALRACAHKDVATLLEPAAWRLLAGSLIGPRMASALRRARGRTRTSSEVTA